MTREETIGQLKFMLEQMSEEPPSECDCIEEWLDTDRKIRSAFKTAIKIIEQEPSEDCVSRQVVAEFLRNHAKDFEDAKFRMAFMTASSLVENTNYIPPVTTTQNWISASEKLPKAGEYIGDVAKYYLVQNEYGDMLVARYTHSGYWEQIYQLQPIGDEIVAWMPLPKSYKVEMERVNE